MFESTTSFNQDISRWNMKRALFYDDMFNDCPINKEYMPKKVKHKK